MASHGLQFQNARTSRFAFDVGGYTLKSGVALRFFDKSGRLFKEIPLNGSSVSGEDGLFSYHIDNVREVAHKNIYAHLVHRANRVVVIYQKVVPIVSLLACIVYLCSTLLVILELRSKQSLKTLPVWLILSGIALTFILFLFGMCLITTTSFYSLHYLYTAPAYILLLMFCGVSLFWGAETVIAFNKRGST